jgi:prepilin-type processing-associated H-X9-DG protein
MSHPCHISESAVSLVELLVGVAIIAVLATLVFPAYNSTITNADRTQCANNLKVISGAAIQYASDHDFQYLPPIMNGSEGFKQWMINTDFLSYLGATAENPPKVFACPTAQKGKSQTGLNYGMNITELGINAENFNAPGYSPNTKLIKRPSQKIYFIDALDWWVMRDRAAAYTNGEAYRVMTPASRHRLAANVAFFDGHVECLSQSQLVTNESLWNIPAN